MTEQHLSIGEVLTLLQDEFPDVTISKIRFLESQGLIDPERTPSGYRKFYAADIERLRWILTQQRENFLPLKVIKDRLEENPTGAPPESDGPLVFDPNGRGDSSAAPLVASASSAGGASTSSPTASSGARSTSAPAGAAPTSASSTSGAASVGGGRAAPATVRSSMPAGELSEPADQPEPIWMADLARSGKGGARAPKDRKVQLDADVSDTSLTAAELQAAAGLSAESLHELEKYGLIAGRPMGDDTYYDGDALIVARKAAAFIGHGVEARHLRMFKVAAEREAGFLEQLAMPLLKQRNPEARRQAVDLVETLADHGHDLRAALLRANLRKHLDRA